MSAILHRFRVMYAVALVTYKEWFAYRTHSLVSAFVGPAYFLVQVSIWRVVYRSTGSINGMSLDDMIAYYAITTLISFLTSDSADWNLQMLIRTGKYLTFALRPLHHRFFALSQKVGHRVLGFFFEFLPVLVIFVVFFGMRPAPAHWGYFVMSTALSYLMVFYINYTIGIAGFWLVKTQGLRSVIHIISQICSGMLFPLLLLPEGLQRIVFFLPFQYTTYVTSMVYTGSYSLGVFSMDIRQIVCIQAAYVLFFHVLSEILYRAGMKRFTAVGA